MHLLHPAVLLLLGLAVPWILLAERRADGTTGRRVLRALARTTVVGLVVLALAQPSWPAREARPRRVVVAVDRSRAMSEAARLEASRAVARAREEAAARDVPIEVLGFSTRSAPSVDASVPTDLEGWPGTAPSSSAGPTRVPEPPEAPSARPAAGLAGALAAFRLREAGTILLVSTGRGDLGGLAAAAQAARENGVGVRAEAVPRLAPPPRREGPRIRALDLPTVARGPFDVRALVEGVGPLEVGLLIDGEAIETRTLPAGEGGRTVTFPDLTVDPGRYELGLRVREAQDSEMATLERRLLRVEAPPRVLLAGERAETSRARRSLEAQGFTVEIVPPAALASALAAEPPGVDAVVLDAAAALAMTPEAQDLLARRIGEGLGLLLVAGPSEEAWTKLAASRLADVLPLSSLPPPAPPPPTEAPPPPEENRPDVEPPEPDEGPGLRAERRPEEAVPISMAIVLDRSGSMEGPKFSMAREAARRAAASLSKFDRVAVITFAEDATVDIPPTPATRLGSLVRLAGVIPGGNTDIYGAIVKAREVLEAEDAPIRHLILLTDGKQTARFAVFGRLVDGLTRAGITVTTVGLGPTHSEELLKRIAILAPRGRYIPADTAAQLPTILTRDTQIVDEFRKREAEALARIEDKDRNATEPAPPPSDEPGPTPETADPSAPSPPPSPEGTDTDDRAPLALVRPHEATAGLEQEPLPAVGRARRSRLRRGAALLVIRGDDEPALAATRVGLGRVLQWALPEDAAGLDQWSAFPRLFVQAIRSVRAPLGSLVPGPLASVLSGPDGERLRLDAEPGAAAPAVRVRWHGPDGAVRDLGTHPPGTHDDLALPRAPEGASVTVKLSRSGDPPGEEEVLLGAITYLARGGRREVPRAGDEAALEARLGAGALRDPTEPLLGPPVEDPRPTPLWPYALVLALLLLPVDAVLHRRSVRWST